MIYIEVINYRWEVNGPDDFQNWLAMSYISLVKDAITNQEYAGGWKSLNPDYKKRKELSKLSPNMWEATGELKNQLRLKYGRVIGFDNRIKHSRSKLTYTQIARTLEYGTSKIPARPLFRWVLHDMEAHIDVYKNIYIQNYGLSEDDF